MFVVPQLVLTEAACLIGKLLGPVADASYLRPMAEAPLDCYAIDGKDLLRMAELIGTYADLRIGVVDAAVIAVAERLGANDVATLDHRHFTVVRPRPTKAFTVFP